VPHSLGYRRTFVPEGLHLPRPALQHKLRVTKTSLPPRTHTRGDARDPRPGAHLCRRPASTRTWRDHALRARRNRRDRTGAGDDRAVQATYAAGRKVHSRDEVSAQRA